VTRCTRCARRAPDGNDCCARCEQREAAVALTVLRGAADDVPELPPGQWVSANSGWDHFRADS